ncbi:putative TIM-barrel fold metal-dependent hydrolase [Rhizobium redzepovicii]
MQGKIALEEHFAIPETLQDSAGFVPGDYWTELSARLLDIQDKRLRLMDAHGIEKMILSLNAPAVQAIPDKAKALEISRRANDFLAEQCVKNPNRFLGFAALPLQDPDAATQELQRCVTTLGFVGALVNGFSQEGDGTTPLYYDLPQYRSFWAEVEKLNIPFYLHPRNPLPQDSRIYAGHSWLMGPTWAFAQETAVHALRLMGSGLFDEHPALRIIVGHMGEGAALHDVAHRQPECLGQGGKELSGQTPDRRLFQREFLHHDVGEFPHAITDRCYAGNRRGQNSVFDRLAIRKHRPCCKLVRQRHHFRSRSAEDRSHQCGFTVQTRSIAWSHLSDTRPARLRSSSGAVH